MLRLSHSRKFPKFRRWIELEEHKGQVIRAIEEGNPEFPQTLVSFLSIALGLSEKYLLRVPWWSCMMAFYDVMRQNAPRIKIPLIVESDSKKQKEQGWDYDGRSWHMYSNLLAKTYGWSLEYIANLEVSEVLPKIQEILTDEQLDREFYWSSSEVAYSYDSSSKTSKFVPLDRPYWMRPKVTAPKKVKLLKALLPVGAVDYKAVGDDLAPKEIKHQ